MKSELELLHEFDRERYFLQKEPINGSGLFYQFRPFKSFWLILEGDCFWATNARFSNDDAEREYGKSIGIKSGIISNIDYPDADIDQYIVCFCAVQDLLSQWRGYAPYGGVSIGFDFNMHTPFTIYPNNVEMKDGYAKRDADNLISYAKATKVLYYVEDEDFKGIKDCLMTHTSAVTADMEANERKRRFLNMIPYIKHPRFEEEKEYRIVVSSNDFPTSDNHRFSKYINYKCDGDKKIPFIILKPGNHRYNRDNCSVRIRIKLEDEDYDWDRDLYAYVDKSVLKDKPRVFSCIGTTGVKDLDDSYCYGCTRRRWIDDESTSDIVYCRHQSVANQYVSLSTNESNSVIVSQGKNQQEVFEKVHEWAMMKNKDIRKTEEHIKVWCEGHLPIRTIMVGPCKNQNEMEESIKNFCLHSKQYWLRDVKVIKSDIPYRTPNRSTE